MNDEGGGGDSTIESEADIFTDLRNVIRKEYADIRVTVGLRDELANAESTIRMAYRPNL